MKQLIYRIGKWLLKLEKRNNQALHYSLWGLEVNEFDHLVIGGCDCIDLVEKYNTPVHIIDKNRLQKNYSNFYESFKAFTPIVEIYYSYKTNHIPGVLKVLHKLGAGAEVVSPYELWLAIRLGVDASRIIYNGPNKSDKALKMAIEKQIKLINIDSLNEIQRIEKIAKEIGKVVCVGIRVCTGVGWSAQFGLQIENGEVFKAIEQCIKLKCFKVCGFHTHLGTMIKDVSKYVEAVKILLKLVKDVKEKFGVHIEYLDLGGGFGIPTVKKFERIEAKLHRLFGRFPSPPKFEDCPSINVFAENIVNTIRAECIKYNLEEPTLLLEPGRVITSDTQILLIGVDTVKTKRGNANFVITNGGTNIALPASGEYHEVFVASRMNAKSEEVYNVVGPLCTPSDLLYRYKMLPRLNENDVLAIMDAGAYFVPGSNNFCYPRPAVVMVSDGKQYIIRKQESYENMTDLDNFDTELS